MGCIRAPVYRHPVVSFDHHQLHLLASMSGVPAASFLAPRSKRTDTYSPSVSTPRTLASTATSTATAPPGPSTSTSHLNYAPVFNNALEAYKRKTKTDLASHPLLPKLQSCDSPAAILSVLVDQTPAFSQSQNGDDRLTNWVSPTVNVLYSFSTALDGNVDRVNI